MGGNFISQSNQEMFYLQEYRAIKVPGFWPLRRNSKNSICNLLSSALDTAFPGIFLFPSFCQLLLTPFGPENILSRRPVSYAGASSYGCIENSKESRYCSSCWHLERDTVHSLRLADIRWEVHFPAVSSSQPSLTDWSTQKGGDEKRNTLSINLCQLYGHRLFHVILTNGNRLDSWIFKNESDIF